MEGLLSQRVTPLLKCVVLFLFIFTAKVLTSRPQESQDIRNSITHSKTPSHYVRTFTKYHHRRTIQWNNIQDLNNYWPQQDHTKTIRKRSVEFLNSDEFVSGGANILNLNNLNPDLEGDNKLGFEKQAISSSKDGGLKNGVPVEDQYKMKKAIVFTDAPTTIGPRVTCLYKMQSVSMSVTPQSYLDDPEAQLTVINDYYDHPGELTQTILPSGEIVQTQICSDPSASCYTFYQDSNDNITIFGQGCWRSSTDSVSYDKCIRLSSVPNSMICHCAQSLCNANFKSFEEEVPTPKAELTMDAAAQRPNYPSLAACAILSVAALLVMAVVVKKIYCKKQELDKDDVSDAVDIEKGEVMGTGEDALATGLLCVDNLTLIEHIGEGKFGTVWRGSLGGTPVAVKLYRHVNAWQKETSVYAIPHLAHPNLLRYYGSDSRSSPLCVMELCAGSLRARLQHAPLAWREFAALAHGLAAALAHLHTPSGNKPCIVHRDVNSNNVLVTASGSPRLADLGLAQPLVPRKDHTPTRITEAGTLRYLAPEALEGALDLRCARGALCAVDVFALALVLWELLWRTRGAHAGPAPPYAPPYQHCGLPARPTLAQMQSLVSRDKLRPPLPKGPVAESRALKIAADTCDECWDHDAEARLTAVCVEERMAELQMMILAQGPVIHDNNLHPQTETDAPSAIAVMESDKNSNCTAAQNNDVTVPLLYPQPHIGRNACIERNTHTNTQTHTVELIHKSLKDITETEAPPRSQNVEENCLSVARVTHARLPTLNYDRLNEIRSYQRPLDYVPNDVTSHDSERGPKETNLFHDVKDKSKWSIKKFFDRKLNRNSKALETEVKLVPELANGRTKTSIVNEKPSNIQFERPSNLVLDQRSFIEGPCTLSPPNRTLSPTMLIESEMNRSENKVFRRLPSEETDQNQVFAVIVPKVKPEYNTDLTKTSSSSESFKHSVRTSMSSQSFIKAGHSESEDSTVKKRLSCDNRIINSSGRSSRASVNLELTYIDNIDRNPTEFNDSPFDLNSDCSSSEDEHLLLLSENGGSKITMQTIPKAEDKKKYQNDVLKETGQMKPEFSFNKHQYKYANFDNEFSDPNDKENLSGYSVDNPVYLAALNGEISEFKYENPEKSPVAKPNLKNLNIKRQHSLEQVSDLFTSSGDIHLLNPANRVKTPGDLPVAVRRARRDRALQKGKVGECNRLSLYDDRMMFGNSL